MTNKLINTIKAQIASDQFLGANWLPMDAGETNMPKKNAKEELKLIAQQVHNCKACPLHQSRLHTVPGAGNPDAQIVFVGEAPGATEDQQGIPFVGRAGKLLDDIISAMGLTRDDIFICNILKCRPPGNRDPQTTEILACQSYLHQQLEIIDPEIIITLGAHASRTLLESKQSIGQLRGRFHEYLPTPLAKPIKLIPTYHPAYLLRNYSPDNRRKVWEDMKKVLTELGLPIPKKTSKK